ncbi:uncharacterized protein PODANS_1_22700 [Podospora anserina S mat+]|uniref:Podospora anserina S mat+ genomic DNA chromosome 1, supercontig 6 n=1 Tax=Podospora anserina (strain S / ATCC MYA-4624 / DSM 980 / FGSC 10383) TaxID=515849 RepID=B2AS88_PODAN|nr:uncharacterized protein PODANS_1_22700 [Podospora anserina S mat+]CAP67261.1 unnamed protein product [Podospora anserina S mat+]CDP24672.1 Putative protein of unknown function [Podospora anserina S mat+]
MVASWFSSVTLCCGAEDKEEDRPSTAERKIVVLRDQPAPIQAPTAGPQWPSEKTYERTLERERDHSRGRRYSRDNASMRNWFSKPASSSTSSSTRRLQISGPTNFRHLTAESFQYPTPTPPPAPRQRVRSFRPLELSIYAPKNRLTPILPHLERGENFITPPPRAHTANSSRWDASSTTTVGAPERSYSVMSFHIPRKHVRQSSAGSDVSTVMTAPRIPPKSRARASTAPNTERIVARIASALVEKERLQAEINSVVERQSIYLGSRPSTAIDPKDLYPLPSIPAMPAAAPSFAERLSTDRPSTAPANTGPNLYTQRKTMELAQAAFNSHPPHTPYSPSRYDDEEVTDNNNNNNNNNQTDYSYLDRPLAPPLPLILRPPLRKKKSFSRVSSWLFNPDEQHNFQKPATREGSIDESTLVTTSPRPIKETDGFYQCVAPPEGLPRTSMETSSSVYTYETTSEEEDTKTAPTTNWSPGSSPRVKQTQTPKQTPPLSQRVRFAVEDIEEKEAKSRTFQPSPPPPKMKMEKGIAPAVGLGVPMGMEGHRPLSVGVAF